MCSAYTDHFYDFYCDMKKDILWMSYGPMDFLTVITTHRSGKMEH